MKMMQMIRKTWFAAALLALALIPARARALDLWPLAEFSDERTMVLYPLYEREGNFEMIFPFYYRTNQGRDHHFVWPIAKVSEGRLTRLAPFWYSADADTFTIFPLLRQTPDYTCWTVPPIYTRHDGKFKAVWPFYAQSPNLLFVAPSFVRTTEGNNTRAMMIPFYFSNRSPERASYEVPILFSYATDRSGYDLWLLPFWRSEHGAEQEAMLLPFYFRSAHAVSGGQANRLWLLPWVQGTSPSGRYHGLLPLYFYSQQEANQGNVRQSFNLLWPVYQREVTRSLGGAELAYYHRFLCFSEAKKTDGTRVLSLLGIPIHERTR
jgi:hypothetical protein